AAAARGAGRPRRGGAAGGVQPAGGRVGAEGEAGAAQAALGGGAGGGELGGEAPPRGAAERTFVDFAGAVRTGGRPGAPGGGGQRAREAVAAVYASAATGRELTLPLATDSPIYRRGALGIGELDLPSDSPARRLGLFGVARASQAGRIYARRQLALVTRAPG